ncbi:MAG: sulfurtransferase TusA family protein [Desulfurococcales archaeon]|nr:sulfurtransferase TusA family protein [Desulfurococcales archaeon]
MGKTRVLDYRGIECPEPLIKTLRELRLASSGDTLIVLTDQWECVDKIVSAVEFSGIGRAAYKGAHGYYEISIEVS